MSGLFPEIYNSGFTKNSADRPRSSLDPEQILYSLNYEDLLNDNFLLSIIKIRNAGIMGKVLIYCVQERISTSIYFSSDTT